MRRAAFLVAPLLAAAALSPGTAPAPGGDELESSVALMARIGFCSSPTFSPDGKTIAFVSNMSGMPQVWTVPTEGGGAPAKAV